MKNLFFMALAGVVMFACQTPGEKPVTDNGDTKTVSLKIKTTKTTRATLGYEVPTGAITELTGGTVFFFNTAGETVLAYTLKEADFGVHSASAVIDGVPSSAATVAMIANPAADLTETAPEDFEEFLDASFGIANQASMASATGLTGEEGDEDRQPLAIQGIALLDDLNGTGTATVLSDQNIPDGAEYTHTASISLIPAMSRIEIGTLDTTVGEVVTPGNPAVIVKATNATGLVSFDLVGVYINNYSPNFTLGQEQDDPVFGSTIQPNPADTDWVTAYTALEPSPYLFDPAGGSVTATNGIGKYAYHIFPGAKVPHIIIKGNNFVYSDGRTYSTPKYWRIDSYKEDNAGGDEVEWEPGWVYKISGIAVGDTLPTDDPYDDPKSVQVTVTVQAWQVQNTYVEPR